MDIERAKKVKELLDDIAECEEILRVSESCSSSDMRYSSSGGMVITFVDAVNGCCINRRLKEELLENIRLIITLKKNALERM